MSQLTPRMQPLRVQFILTSMPVGGAETLLVNLIRHMDRQCFAPEVICLKEAGALGSQLSRDIPVHSRLLKSKWDLSIVWRLARLLRRRETDAIVTVGAGDKMFWGRLAARLAGVPVVCSALHSTGWPDGLGTLNRWLTPITDGFIAVAKPHAEHLADREGLPRKRIFMIPNGVDTGRFRPNHARREWLRRELDIPQSSRVIGIVAALREEKNHLQFVDAAREVLRQFPDAHFVIVGDGPERSAIESYVKVLGLAGHFHLLGNRQDTEHILAGLDVFCLTSRNEANPVSILEALACGIPVVAPDVGSIAETVRPKQTGMLTRPLSAESTSDAILMLLGNPTLASSMGFAGRQLVREEWSLRSMVDGYEHLLEVLYNMKSQRLGRPAWERPRAVAASSSPEQRQTAQSQSTASADGCATAAGSTAGPLADSEAENCVSV